MFSEFRFLVLAGAALAALSYVTNIFIANKLGPSEFGQYSYALVLGATFAQVIAFGTGESGIRLRSSYGPKAMSWIFSAKVINFSVICLLALTAAAINRDILIAYGLVVAINGLSYATQYEARRYNIRYAKIYLAERSAVTALVWLGLIYLNSAYLVWVFTALLLVQAISLAFQYYDNREIKLNLGVDALYRVYREGFFLLIFSLSKFAYAGFTRIIIFHQLGDHKLGIFSTAWQFVPLSTLFFAQATKAWRLTITESIEAGDYDKFKYNLRILTLTVFIPTGIACFTLFTFGGEIIDLIFGPEYAATSELVPYIAIYFLVVALDSVSVLVAIALSISKLVAAYYAAFGAATVILCWTISGWQSLEALLAAVIFGHFLAASASALACRNRLRIVFK